LFEARERARFWEDGAARRLFPRGTSLVALFSGPSGTGKTMTAQVIAAELELDLFRIDLATCVSKYIGETAKNLREIFQRAEQMNAVLLFDEADALFSKRTEVRDSHDRHANTDTNYLLQLLESFRGIALLSSNKRENMDAAFVRRIRYILEFARPGAQERLRIWRGVVSELAGPAALGGLESLLERLARVLEMSGAQIKLAVLSALFASRHARQPLGVSHLLHGVGRELGKEGRGISPKERERIERGE
jgi:SpoVK/Ycf46/Vps4 family AAA+-type ATPase